MSIRDTILKNPETIKKCTELVSGLQTEKIIVQAQVAQKLITQNYILKIENETIADALYDKDIECEGLRDQLGNKIDDSKISKYCNEERIQPRNNSERGEKIKRELEKRFLKSLALTKN